MTEHQQNITQLTDHLFRQQSGKMVAVLTKIFGTENLQVAEDVVQDTLLQAVETWKYKGIPDNPSAWLYRVAKNKAIDIIRRNKFSIQYDFSDSERALLQSEYTLGTVMNNMWQEDVVNDDLLCMMFACCHPEISEENQITLILKTLCGFSTAEIAKSFLTSEDTVSKRLYRTKEFFRERKIRPEFPPAELLKDRIYAVLKTIYLIFNEGYNSTHSDTLIRKDLLEQAMYLCNLLCTNHHTQSPDVYAAIALMYFHAARIYGRVSEDGEIILLSHQDRTKWNREMIELGRQALEKGATGDEVSSYHLEAAIAHEHCIAARFEDTNWPRILAFYNWLANIAPSTIVQINRLTVVHKVYGVDRVLEEIDAWAHKADWEKHYLYHSLLGEIYADSDTPKAKQCYERAMLLTQSAPERKLLAKKIAALAI